MDDEDCYSQEKGAHESRETSLESPVSLNDDNDWEASMNTEKHGDIGDMTFCMANYVKEAMKMMFMMRSHHMLTDVVLEVGSELFHAHKVILAAASPYFKVK